MTAILAASDEAFRHQVFEQLLRAGCGEVRVADRPAALAELLLEPLHPIVVMGGVWPAPLPYLRLAVENHALPVMLLDSSAPHTDREVLALGARAMLPSDIPVAALAAALTAVQAGLVVTEPAANAEPTVNTARDRSSGRPLTPRERQILALVAGGTSNKGVARVLGVSANTVKFHLAAVFGKLRASTRAEAVAAAIRRGELSL